MGFGNGKCCQKAGNNMEEDDAIPGPTRQLREELQSKELKATEAKTEHETSKYGCAKCMEATLGLEEKKKLASFFDESKDEKREGIWNKSNLRNDRGVDQERSDE